MSEMFLVLGILLSASVTEAAGLKSAIDGAGPQVSSFVYAFLALVIIGVIGGAAHIMLSFMDNPRPIKYIDRGTVIGMLGTLIGMGLMVIGNIFDALMKFITLVCG